MSPRAAAWRLGPALLLLLPLAAAPAPAGSTAPGPDDLRGDDWAVNLTGVYTVHGLPVLLQAAWDVWSPWPIPYAGYEGRVTNLKAWVTHDLRPDATVSFLWVGAYPDIAFNITVHARGLDWVTRWTWTEHNGCDLNKVLGPQQDIAATVDGKPLQPLDTRTGLVGVALASKYGPGADGHWECNPGGPL